MVNLHPEAEHGHGSLLFKNFLPWTPGWVVPTLYYFGILHNSDPRMHKILYT
jgi:hypothetical protein